MNFSKGKSIVMLSALVLLSTPAAYSYSPAVEDIQDLPSAKTVVVGSQKGFDESHWVYKNLKEITSKHGSLVNLTDKTFDGNKPLTRQEAAILLVNLVGKIEQDNVQLNAVEKAKLDILREELKKDTAMLVGKVAKIETDVETLKGSVSELKSVNKRGLKVGFGEDMYVNGGFTAKFTDYTGGPTKTDQNFDFNSVDIALTGKLTKDWDMRAQFFPSGDTLGDVWVKHSLGKHNKVLIGRTRMPIGIEGSSSPYSLTFANRSQIGRNFGNVRDQGIKVFSNYKYANVYSGVFNGSRNSGDAKGDLNSEMDIATWVDFKPLADYPELGNLTIGGGFVNGRNTYSYDIYGAHIGYKYKKVGIDAEYALADGWNGSTGLDPKQKADGVAFTTTYDINKKWQLAARYDIFDKNTDTADSQIDEYSAGLNYFMYGKNIKVQLNYVYVNNPLANQDSQKVVLQSQFITW